MSFIRPHGKIFEENAIVVSEICLKRSHKFMKLTSSLQEVKHVYSIKDIKRLLTEWECRLMERTVLMWHTATNWGLSLELVNYKQNPNRFLVHIIIKGLKLSYTGKQTKGRALSSELYATLHTSLTFIFISERNRGWLQMMWAILTNKLM